MLAVNHDAALLAFAAMATAGSEFKPKACRRIRAAAISTLRELPALASTRAEAERAIRRSCGACQGCRGI